MSFLQALQVLAGSDAEARNRAAGELDRLLREMAPGLLRATVSSSIGQELIDDAIQHTLIKACLGSARFQGTSEPEARGWCKVVLRNFVRDRFRMLSRQKLPGDEAVARRVDDRTGGSAPVARVAEPGDIEALDSLSKMYVALFEEMRRGHRERAVETLIRSLECHLGSRQGQSLEEQIERFAREDGGSGGKARDRIYKYRERGRVAGCQALGRLARQNRFTDEEISLMRRFLGCKAGEDEVAGELGEKL